MNAIPCCDVGGDVEMGEYDAFLGPWEAGHLSALQHLAHLDGLAHPGDGDPRGERLAGFALGLGLLPWLAGACWLLDPLAEPVQHLVGDLAPAVVDGQ